jgi:hypothetical protein
MHILIEKDSATKVPREVKDLEEAKSFQDMGFMVQVQTEDGMVPLATLLAPAAPRRSKPNRRTAGRLRSARRR